MREFVKNILPPFILNRIKTLFANKFTGNYKSWADAQMHSNGYDNNVIFDKVKNSTLKVHRGEAVFERDSVIFDKIEYSWPLLAALMWVAANDKGKLNVLDFGGSLGSTYFQNRKFLESLDNFTWNIIEQEHFVNFGKENLESKNLKFYAGIQECLANQEINVVVFSSVIAYLSEPYALLDEFVRKKIGYIIFDRTLFNKNKGADSLTVQKVPASIYKASYPCWLFSEAKFRKYFVSKGYILIEDFLAIDGESRRFKSKGFIYKLEN
jgi:putative methyltransferase (TIGR04325 family)